MAQEVRTALERARGVPGGLSAEAVVQLLLQIPTIAAAVGEIREILTRWQKPLLTAFSRL